MAFASSATHAVTLLKITQMSSYGSDPQFIGIILDDCCNWIVGNHDSKLMRGETIKA